MGSYRKVRPTNSEIETYPNLQLEWGTWDSFTFLFPTLMPSPWPRQPWSCIRVPAADSMEGPQVCGRQWLCIIEFVLMAGMSFCTLCIKQSPRPVNSVLWGFANLRNFHTLGMGLTMTFYFGWCLWPTFLSLLPPFYQNWSQRQYVLSGATVAKHWGQEFALSHFCRPEVQDLSAPRSNFSWGVSPQSADAPWSVCCLHSSVYL
jgi:hypothetical protein